MLLYQFISFLFTQSTYLLLQENLRQRIGQDILSIVMKSDRDNDNRIDRKEAKTLALRIRIALQEYGVDFDSEKVNVAVIVLLAPSLILLGKCNCIEWFVHPFSLVCYCRTGKSFRHRCYWYRGEVDAPEGQWWKG